METGAPGISPEHGFEPRVERRIIQTRRRTGLLDSWKLNATGPRKKQRLRSPAEKPIAAPPMARCRGCRCLGALHRGGARGLSWQLARNASGIPAVMKEALKAWATNGPLSSHAGRPSNTQLEPPAHRPPDRLGPGLARSPMKPQERDEAAATAAITGASQQPRIYLSLGPGEKQRPPTSASVLAAEPGTSTN